MLRKLFTICAYMSFALLGCASDKDGLRPTDAQPARQACQDGPGRRRRLIDTRRAIAAARRVVHLWEQAYPHDCRPQAAIEAVENWVICPCPSHRTAAQEAERDASSAALYPGRRDTRAFEPPVGLGGAINAASAAALAARGVSDPAFADAWRLWESCVNALLLGEHPALFEEPRRASDPDLVRAHSDADRTIREAVQREVTPWLAGREDPVRQRVDARASFSCGGHRPRIDESIRGLAAIDALYHVNNLVFQAVGLSPGRAEPAWDGAHELERELDRVRLVLGVAGFDVLWDARTSSYVTAPRGSLKGHPRRRR